MGKRGEGKRKVGGGQGERGREGEVDCDAQFEQGRRLAKAGPDRNYLLRLQVMPGRSGTGALPASGPSVQSVRLIVTCLTIAGVFTICWMPIQLALILLYVGNIENYPIYLLRWLSIFNCFNSCINPIIYGLMWRPFRAALRDVSSNKRNVP